MVCPAFGTPVPESEGGWSFCIPLGSSGLWYSERAIYLGTQNNNAYCLVGPQILPIGTTCAQASFGSFGLGPSLTTRRWWHITLTILDRQTLDILATLTTVGQPPSTNASEGKIFARNIACGPIIPIPVAAFSSSESPGWFYFRPPNADLGTALLEIESYDEVVNLNKRHIFRYLLTAAYDEDDVSCSGVVPNAHDPNPYDILIDNDHGICFSLPTLPLLETFGCCDISTDPTGTPLDAFDPTPDCTRVWVIEDSSEAHLWSFDINDVSPVDRGAIDFDGTISDITWDNRGFLWALSGTGLHRVLPGLGSIDATVMQPANITKIIPSIPDIFPCIDVPGLPGSGILGFNFVNEKLYVAVTHVNTTSLPYVYTNDFYELLPIGDNAWNITKHQQSGIASGGTQEESGWTDLTLPAGGIAIYVSSSGGSDSNDGLTTSTPKENIAAGYALLRDGEPDQLLLKCGDTWDLSDEVLITKSAKSITQYQVIGNYGTGNRPHLHFTGSTSGDVGMHTLDGEDDGHSGIALVGLKLTTDNIPGDCGGITFLSWQYVLIEDCEVIGFGDNIVVQDTASNGTFRVRGLKVRRNVIVDSQDPDGASPVGEERTIGIYIGGCDDWLIEENVLDKNGYVHSSIFTRNCYVHETCGPGTFIGNVSARGGADGLQQRPGGIMDNNLFIQNPMGCTIGSGGGTSTVKWNVFLDADNIGGIHERGAGIWVHAPGEISYNFFGYNTLGTGDGVVKAINFLANSGTITRNYVYDWARPTGSDGQCYFFGAGSGIIVFEDNIGYQVSQSICAEHSVARDPSTIQASNNSWYEPSGGAFLSFRPLTWEQWQIETGDDGEFLTSPPVDPLCRISDITGLSADAFMTACRGQSKQSWDIELTADFINAEVRVRSGMPTRPPGNVTPPGNILPNGFVLGDIAFSGNGTAYGVVFNEKGQENFYLSRININSQMGTGFGIPTFVASNNDLENVTGMDFLGAGGIPNPNNETLYGVLRSGQLVAINKDNANITLISGVQIGTTSYGMASCQAGEDMRLLRIPFYPGQSPWVFVVDISSSMANNNRLNRVKEDLQNFFSSYVRFNDEVYFCLYNDEQTPVFFNKTLRTTADITTVNEFIEENFVPSGAIANLCGAMTYVGTEGILPANLKSVIVISDGNVNNCSGTSELTELMNTIVSTKPEVTFYAVGVDPVNPTLLRHIGGFNNGGYTTWS